MGFKLSVNSNESKINFLRKNKKFGGLNIHFFQPNSMGCLFFFFFFFWGNIRNFGWVGFFPESMRNFGLVKNVDGPGFGSLDCSIFNSFSKFQIYFTIFVITKSRTKLLPFIDVFSSMQYRLSSDSKSCFITSSTLVYYKSWYLLFFFECMTYPDLCV